MSNKNFNYSFSWTQPYTSLNPVYQYNELTVQEEIDRVNEIDDQVALMNTYPEAEQLLRNIFSQK